MAAAYFKAAIPEPYRILGLQLRPFSLGHYMILQRFGNNFVSEDATVATREDLIFAVFVCSLTYEGFHEAIQSRDVEMQFQRWGKKIGMFDLAEKAKIFQEYLAASQKVPEMWIEKEDEAPSGAHWSHTVLTTLTGHLGYSRSEALNMPLSQALYDFYKHAENMGVVRLQTEDELKFQGLLNGA